MIREFVPSSAWRLCSWKGQYARRTGCRSDGRVGGLTNLSEEPRTRKFPGVWILDGEQPDIGRPRQRELASNAYWAQSVFIYLID